MFLKVQWRSTTVVCHQLHLPHLHMNECNFCDRIILNDDSELLHKHNSKWKMISKIVL